jgi:hypothetical protein
MPSDEDLIKGYLEELRGFEAKGDEAGVKAVKAELRRLGALGKPPAKKAEERLPKAKDVFPELKDKAWVKGEKDHAEHLIEAVEEPEEAPATAGRTVASKGKAKK